MNPRWETVWSDEMRLDRFVASDRFVRHYLAREAFFDGRAFAVRACGGLR